MTSRMIFLNLPVAELNRSKDFYEALGWKVNQEFTDDNAACIVIDDNICVMLLTTQFFTTFCQRKVADTGEKVGATYGLALTSAAEVDALATAALAAGGTEEINADKRAQEEQVGMYSRSFLDPDGHQWEPFWMDYTSC
ncbi:glyoxalase/bleomycin resistance/extradiol dioxygenase family protein [Nocardia colli]|uniref:Glyoxalase/bleomycin resistance/extradiol dioxygenase family protein n=1 Tax=Nocardia colli TaxID=2545717 RepID=A0A5N0EFA2_9NOCA|nr:VOC family protein [Nocardia colli]KAA8886785.1 glyoxalase/bleomycin resistance/extradiol dioxygenase family protein [Nocardia colli]